MVEITLQDVGVCEVNGGECRGKATHAMIFREARQTDTGWVIGCALVCDAHATKEQHAAFIRLQDDS